MEKYIKYILIWDFTDLEDKSKLCRAFARNDALAGVNVFHSKDRLHVYLRSEMYSIGIEDEMVHKYFTLLEFDAEDTTKIIENLLNE